MTKENRVIKKDFIIESTKVDTEKREFTAVITDSSVDRDKEVLLPEGMNISNFKKNGIILFNHDRNIPIGTALSLRRKGDSWIAKGRFAKEGTGEKIDEIWSLVDQGILKGISIGFIEHEGRIPNDQDRKRFGKEVNYVITKFELIEFSIATVVSNTNTIISALKSLNLDPKFILGEDYKDISLDDTVEMTEEETKEIVEDVIPIPEKNEIIEKTSEKEIEVEIEKELVELEKEVVIEPEMKEKIIEIAKKKDIDVKVVMKYFIKEIKKEIKKSKGNLFSS